MHENVQSRQFKLIAYFESEYSAEELEEIESIATGRDGEVTMDMISVRV